MTQMHHDLACRQHGLAHVASAKLKIKKYMPKTKHTPNKKSYSVYFATNMHTSLYTRITIIVALGVHCLVVGRCVLYWGSFWVWFGSFSVLGTQYRRDHVALRHDKGG